MEELTYTPHDHLKKWLESFNKQPTIDDDTYNSIINYIRKDDPNADITRISIKNAMKKMGLIKLYEEIPAVLSKYKNIKPIEIKQIVIEDILLIHKLFYKELRKYNFESRTFSYAYLLDRYSMYRDIEKYYNTSKDIFKGLVKSNNYSQFDHILKKICEETDYLSE